MNPQQPPAPLTCATLDWQNDTPVSVQFADVYFSREDGAAETRYVFLQQNDLPARWQAWQTPGSFTIGETGFGTGLNFFCAWELWRTLRKPGQHLHFVSVEQFPLQPADLEKACNLRPEFASLGKALLDQYPPLVSGLHRLHFLDDNVTLTLIFADAAAGFAQLDGVVDAWFLDGFAPARNPQMWQPALFNAMARLSHSTTTFATFTSAGVVKRGLRDAGFQVEKHPGFGRKRDMLRGRFVPPENAAADRPPAQQPWYWVDYARTPPGHVAVIGAGLAGCSAASALARRGWQVTVLEREPHIAQQASGNATGITYARLSPHDTAQNRWYIGSYLYACRFIRALFESQDIPAGTDWDLNGVLQLAFDADESAAQQALRTSGLWPETVAQFLDAAQVRELLGIATDHSGLLMNQGGWLNPATLCRSLLNHPAITLHTGFAVSGLERSNERWRIRGLASAFDAVIFANTFDANRFSAAEHLPLRWVRGQVSHVPATAASRSLRHAINYEGYINPARDGFHCVGATFHPRDKDPAERLADHQHNLDQLQSALPELAAQLATPDPASLSGRVGFRCQTPDYLPLVGPLPDTQAFSALYGDALNSGSKQPLPPGPMLPGLYITTAFGAKGITGAPLAAEILASYLTGEPQPVDRDVLFALHPARFLQRALKRRT